LCPGYLGRRGRAGRALIRLALAPFAHVMCVNTNIRDALAAVGMAPARLSVLPAFLGVETPGALANADAVMIARMRPYLVAAGGGGPEYGLDVLIAAVDALRRRYLELGCVVMGGGDPRRVREAINARGVERHVVALGEVAHERYLTLLARADVFVRPSLVDGDAISVREALALGRPVVASDTDFRPDGVTLFRRGDADDLAAKLGMALEQRAVAPRAAAAVSTLDEVMRIYARVRADSAGAPTRVTETP
jgi:glycosyltransferase involved in cell wall biosynthesis